MRAAFASSVVHRLAQHHHYRVTSRCACCPCTLGIAYMPPGWSLLHRLADEAAKASAAATDADGTDVGAVQRVALLQQLMQEVVGRVQAVAAGLEAKGTAEAVAAAARIKELCLNCKEPEDRHYAGHSFMLELLQQEWRASRGPAAGCRRINDCHSW